MKKKLFFFFLIYTTLTFSQNNYFVSKDGTRNFKSIAAVNSTKLLYGDIVSFNSGEEFADAVLFCQEGVTYNTFNGTTKAIIGNISANISSETTIQINAPSVTLDNLKILGYKDAESVVSFSKNGITISNCEIIGGQNSHEKWSFGIKQKSSSVSDMKISNNIIHGFGGAGIYWSRPYNVDISYNEIFDLWRTDAIVNSGAQAIQRATFGDGKNPEDVWDCAYTVNVHHNNIHDFEMTAFMGYSRMIFEYNEIHHNLDERIYRGGVKHGSVGKLWDNYGTSDSESSLGSLGLIFRYNYIHDLKRFGQPNYTYDKSTDYHRKNGIIPSILSTNNGNNHPIYLSSGLAVYSNGMASEYADDYNKDGEPDFLGAPDYILSGLGYGNYWIHNNLFFNCSNQIGGRAYNYKKEFQSNLGSYFVNNTIINCGWQSHLTDDNGLMISQANSQSPHTVANNIIDYVSPTARYAGRWREKIFTWVKIFTSDRITIYLQQYRHWVLIMLHNLNMMQLVKRYQKKNSIW